MPDSAAGLTGAPVGMVTAPSGYFYGMGAHEKGARNGWHR
jgi:hypothetical protein